MLKRVILDGFTLDGEFPGKGYCPAVKFKYRPALPEVVLHYLQRDKPSGQEAAKLMAALLKDHLVEWEVEDPLHPGQMAPITVENLLKIPQVLLTYLVNEVCSYNDWKDDAKN